MNGIENAGRFLCRIIIIVGICHILTQSQPTFGAQGGPVAVGRENPFAQINKPNAAKSSKNILHSSDFGGEIPELFIATVKLKSLDAQTLSSTIVGMSSSFGSVSADLKSNSLVICDTEETLKKIVTEVNKADASPQQMVFFKTVTLKFLEAESLLPVLKKMASPYGSITANKNTNSLIIGDTEENLTRILSEIEKADTTPKQVLVEVVIVDVQLSDDTEIGVNWDILSNKNYDIMYRQNFTSRLGSVVADTDSIANSSAFNTTGVGGDFSVISGTIRHVVSMLQQKRDVEILASPRAMMVSGQSATIKAVEEIPFSEVSDTAAGGAGALTSTEFKEVGITLDVTSTITDGNNIFLTLNAEQSVRTGESSTGIPVVDSRQVDTSLMLTDGQIIVMGGLRRQEKTRQVDQVPFLGDIPLIGFLFKSTNVLVNNTELIVFISPHIYEDGEPLPKDAMAKHKEITEKPMLDFFSNEVSETSRKILLEETHLPRYRMDDEITEKRPADPNSTAGILRPQRQ